MRVYLQFKAFIPILFTNWNPQNPRISICKSAFILGLVLYSLAFSQELVKASAQQGEGIYGILRRHKLVPDLQNRNFFIELNRDRLYDKELLLGRTYELPIYRFHYNGQSIRTTLNYNDYQHAKKIQRYNESLVQAGIKKQNYTTDLDLWVPFELYPHQHQFDKRFESQNDPVSSQGTSLLGEFSIFGKYARVNRLDSRLQGTIFYITSGHGGPDPGAVGRYGRYSLHEDEYAYDISLRLARRLLEHGAKVYVVVRDPNDGIRDEGILRGDRDEYYIGGERISSRHVKRLDQRVAIVNKLYRENGGKRAKQYSIVLHVDSRPNTQRIDIFYYYQKNDQPSKNMAISMYRTVKQKYAENQPGRGYRGLVTTRNLYVMRGLYPSTIYIELGNIRNRRDQLRFVETNNRQAVANWLCLGVLNYFSP
ncbi:N-acetylmuramoyl-L-alanine amidase [candidate division KSB1 bacterium]|jgi:N-acetylmuramoyl-L-alanine amidase|nr:N-acetylmuramoyl-L-alanine amidase [candidate division KSB1 bacterium]